MLFKINNLLKQTDIINILDALKRFLSQEDTKFVVTFHKDDTQTSDSKNVIILDGNYEFTTPLIYNLMPKYPNMELSKDFEEQEALNYKRIIVEKKP